MGIRIQTVEGLFRVPCTGGYGLGMILRTDPLTPFIDIVVGTHQEVAQTDHRLTHRMELEKGRHTIHRGIEAIVDLYLPQGDLLANTLTNHHNRRVSWKTEGIQEGEQEGICKTRHTRYARHSHVHHGEQEGVHPHEDGFHINRTQTKTKEEHGDALGKLLENDVDATTQGGNGVPHGVDGLKDHLNEPRELRKDCRNGTKIGTGVTTEDLPHTELKVLLRIHAEPPREGHNQRTTPLIGPVFLDSANIDQCITSYHHGNARKDHQDHNKQRIGYRP